MNLDPLLRAAVNAAGGPRVGRRVERALWNVLSGSIGVRAAAVKAGVHRRTLQRTLRRVETTLKKGRT